MGTRVYMRVAEAAKVAAGVISITLFFSAFNASIVEAAALTPEQRQQQIAEQQAKEQQAQSQKAKDNQEAQKKVADAMASEEPQAPGVATNVRVSTSTSTSNIAEDKRAKGYRYVKLKWDAAQGATRYFVYYTYKQGGTFKVKGKEVTKTSKKMLFKNNREVFLKVLSYNGDKQGAFSEQVVIWPGYGEYVNAVSAKFKSAVSMMYAGSSQKFKLTSSASMLKTYKVSWTSSDTNVAKVTSAGTVKAKNPGTTVITAKTHTGHSVSQQVTVKKSNGNGVPDVVGLTKKQAQKALNDAGFKASFKIKFIRKSTLEEKYPGVAMGTAMKQNQKAGSSLAKGSTVKVTLSDEIYDCGVGVEAMVKWAEAVAADNSYGYSMGVYTGRGLDRLCPYTNSGASKDYDCATFVNAALAFSGMGADYMNATHKPSPVVGGVKNLMIKNGWKKVTIKTKSGRRKPKVSELKRGDIVLDVRRHIQIHVGDGMDVGAHNNYDGRTGDSSGREVSVNYSWTGYAEVYRYYGNIGK